MNCRVGPLPVPLLSTYPSWGQAMHLTSVLRLTLITLLLAVLPACDNHITTSDEPEIRDSDLTFMRFAPDAPPLADTVVSFWARRGEDRKVQIQYEGNGAYGYGHGICLEFIVPAAALLPSQASMVGDSVRITVRVVDSSRFDFRFEPAGLRFSPEQPAELRVFYSWADPDLNGDGVVDEKDAPLAEGFGFWRQELPGDPWQKIPTARLTDSEEIRARITGFTRYAVATD